MSSLRRGVIGALLITFAVGLSAEDLSGLWKAKKRFGPDARGTLVIKRSGTTFTADMGGRIVPVRIENSELTFDLPDHQGTFRGKLEDKGIRGHWLRPAAPSNISVYASGVFLEPDGPNRWRGSVVPLEDEFTFYLLLQKQADGSYGALLRNPERDQGGMAGVERLTLDGPAVKLLGKRGEVAVGTYDAENDSLVLDFVSRGRNYDFTRDGDESDFYPRGKKPAPYVYRAPLARDDGWSTGTLVDADIDRPAIEKLVQRIVDMPMESADAMQIHALLIARHGKLVLEEYFHGQHRDKLHETRSAAKSLTATVIGAAMQAGAPLTLSSGVYQVMNTVPTDAEPLKRAMTLEHLLTMTGGYFCDDTNDAAPGNENTMNESDEPDYYRYTLRVPMATPPGENSVYCSAMPNLALGMLGRATGESPLYAFDRLVAAPLQIKYYAWPLDPAGNPYGGGSVQLLPRDFMKLGQLMLDGGTWQGRRILAKDFATRASSPLYHLRNITYGYLWWGEDYPYKDRTLRTYSARGAGGQTVTVIPDLDLVITTHAAHYSSGKLAQQVASLIPRSILPAVRERGDDASAPVVDREFTTPYGPSKDGSRVKPPTTKVQ